MAKIQIPKIKLTKDKIWLYVLWSILVICVLFLLLILPSVIDVVNFLLFRPGFSYLLELHPIVYIVMAIAVADGAFLTVYYAKTNKRKVWLRLLWFVLFLCVVFLLIAIPTIRGIINYYSFISHNPDVEIIVGKQSPLTYIVTAIAVIDGAFLAIYYAWKCRKRVRDSQDNQI